jgi:N6-adenosine-specific RNA methylase IME4
MKFQVIVSDPPWSFSDKLKMSNVKRGAETNYNGTMPTNSICDLPVKEIADPNGCVLALWVPSSLLQDGMDVMNAWGFKQKQTYVWCKSKKETSIYNLINSLSGSSLNDKIQYMMENLLSFGMGRLFRQSHEICLIGTNNNGIYKQLENRSQRSVSFEQNLKHSQKPEDLQDSFDLMFKGNKLEMFARRQRQGWVCVGNEAPSIMYEDIKVSLEKLING